MSWDAENHEMFTSPLAHVTGLCREHHDAVEAHEAWIQLDEETLEFFWYDAGDLADEWVRVGALDPQPGGREKNHRPRRKRFVSDDDLRKRRSVSIKLPIDVDGLYWKNLLTEAEKVELSQDDTPFDRTLDEVEYSGRLGKVSTGKLLITILERYTGRAAA
jgi:hypothetical protein